ncbi:MAG TPA: cytochrome C oxidase subunit IV family protein [Polyangiaceae bacterium]|nr:cytochrome C oxidase subunit IV family protein [Polyangiaceae bacterium]
MAKKEEDHVDHHDDMGHALSPYLLIAVWVVLMGFTGLTVFCSRLGLGPQASFAVAMIIATIKAGLVLSVFMHLWWDKRMNLFAFLGSFLFVMLFIGMALTDKSEYARDLIQNTDQAAQQTATGTPGTPAK